MVVGCAAAAHFLQKTPKMARTTFASPSRKQDLYKKENL
jgi:hypothetical protein